MAHNIHCVGCKKKPEELREYIEMEKEDGLTPSENVIANEGTYNRSTGHFYCTDCYIRLGMPKGKAR